MLLPSVNSTDSHYENSGASKMTVMEKAPRKSPSAEQLADAARLLDLWNRREPKISQLQFAIDTRIGRTQGSVWQYLMGKIPLNLVVAIKFARGLGCEVSDFSPTLGAQITQSRGVRPKSQQRTQDTRPLSEAEQEKMRAELVEWWNLLEPGAKRRIYEDTKREFDSQIVEMEATLHTLKRKLQMPPAIEDAPIERAFGLPARSEKAHAGKSKKHG